MNKNDLIRSVHEKLPNQTLKDLDKIVDAVFDSMSDALAKGEEVSLPSFGTFSLATQTIKSVKTSVKKSKG